jgi:hypothetical protein
VADLDSVFLSENLNWVSNAQNASGPTPKQPPDVADPCAASPRYSCCRIEARSPASDSQAGVLPLTAAAGVNGAAKNGYAYRPDEKGAT